MALVLGDAKSRNALAAHVDEEDKKEALIQGSLDGIRTMTVIHESGLHKPLSRFATVLLSLAENASRWRKTSNCHYLVRFD